MILGIESSCDESAVALFDPAQGLAGEWVHSQLDLHQEYGGVVPDLAAREHMAQLPTLLNYILQLQKANEVKYPIKTIAVTQGPGLAGCLAMGIAAAKALGLAWKIPVVGVNHLRGHAFSPFIALHKENPSFFSEKLKTYLPHLGFLISGGNTLLFELDIDLTLKILAQTVDDAAGEAFDKGAKLLGMPYPGGALIEKEALLGNSQAYSFPKAFPNAHDFKFSFSGLKTSLRYLLEKMSTQDITSNLPDLCASYQHAIVEQLSRKLKHVLRSRKFKSIGLSGGVANNQYLYQAIHLLAQESNLPLFRALREHTLDNAGMIAFAAFIDPLGTQLDSKDKPLSFNPSLSLTHIINNS